MGRITDNPVRDAEEWIAEQDKWLSRLPKCDYCGEPLQDDFYYDLLGDKVCAECVEKMKRRNDFENYD